MLIYNGTGGVIFKEDKIFLLQNKEGEWILPKCLLTERDKSPQENIIENIKLQTGIDAKILAPDGKTNYEFYAVTKEWAMCNKITWFLLEAENCNYYIKPQLGYKDGGFYSIEEAVKIITKDQDKSLANIAYKRYKELCVTI